MNNHRHPCGTYFNDSSDFMRSLKNGDVSVDDGVIDLVIALNEFGLHTSASCAGHLHNQLVDRRPYVFFASCLHAVEIDKLEALLKTINRFNNPNNVKW